MAHALKPRPVCILTLATLAAPLMPKVITHGVKLQFCVPGPLVRSTLFKLHETVQASHKKYVSRKGGGAVKWLHLTLGSFRPPRTIKQPIDMEAEGRLKMWVGQEPPTRIPGRRGGRQAPSELNALFQMQSYPFEIWPYSQT